MVSRHELLFEKSNFWPLGGAETINKETFLNISLPSSRLQELAFKINSNVFGDSCDKCLVKNIKEFYGKRNAQRKHEVHVGTDGTDCQTDFFYIVRCFFI